MSRPTRHPTLWPLRNVSTHISRLRSPRRLIRADTFRLRGIQVWSNDSWNRKSTAGEKCLSGLAYAACIMLYFSRNSSYIEIYYITFWYNRKTVVISNQYDYHNTQNNIFLTRSLKQSYLKRHIFKKINSPAKYFKLWKLQVNKWNISIKEYLLKSVLRNKKLFIIKQLL